MSAPLDLTAVAEGAVLEAIRQEAFELQQLLFWEDDMPQHQARILAFIDQCANLPEAE